MLARVTSTNSIRRPRAEPYQSEEKPDYLPSWYGPHGDLYVGTVPCRKCGKKISMQGSYLHLSEMRKGSWVSVDDVHFAQMFNLVSQECEIYGLCTNCVAKESGFGYDCPTIVQQADKGVDLFNVVDFLSVLSDPQLLEVCKRPLHIPISETYGEISKMWQSFVNNYSEKSKYWFYKFLKPVYLTVLFTCNLEEEEERGTCPICLTIFPQAYCSKYNFVYLNVIFDCGHGMCRHCSQSHELMGQTKCPICRAAISKRL
jgi:hypothetical protein